MVMVSKKWTYNMSLETVSFQNPGSNGPALVMCHKRFPILV